MLLWYWWIKLNLKELRGHKVVPVMSSKFYLFSSHASRVWLGFFWETPSKGRSLSILSEKGIVQISEKGIVQISEKGIVQISEKGIVQIPEKGIVQISEKGIVQIPEKGIVQISKKGIVQISEKEVPTNFTDQRFTSAW